MLYDNGAIVDDSRRESSLSVSLYEEWFSLSERMVVKT